MYATRRRPLRGWTWPQLTTLALGAIYTIVGSFGFVLTGGHHFFGHAGASVLGFTVNPFHSLVHVFIGLSGLALSRTPRGARAYGWMLATVFGSAFVFGLFAAGRNWDLLGLNWPDNIQHLVVAVGGGVIAAADPESPGVGDRAARA